MCSQIFFESLVRHLAEMSASDRCRRPVDGVSDSSRNILILTIWTCLCFVYFKKISKSLPKISSNKKIHHFYGQKQYKNALKKCVLTIYTVSRHPGALRSKQKGNLDKLTNGMWSQIFGNHSNNNLSPHFDGQFCPGFFFLYWSKTSRVSSRASERWEQWEQFLDTQEP